MINSFPTPVAGSISVFLGEIIEFVNAGPVFSLPKLEILPTEITSIYEVPNVSINDGDIFLTLVAKLDGFYDVHELRLNDKRLGFIINLRDSRESDVYLFNRITYFVFDEEK